MTLCTPKRFALRIVAVRLIPEDVTAIRLTRMILDVPIPCPSPGGKLAQVRARALNMLITHGRHVRGLMAYG